MSTVPNPRRLRRCLLLSAKCFAVLLALFLLLIATPPGLWLCAKTASTAVSAFTPFSLRISGTSGMLPLRLNIARIELLDRAGTWLTIERVALRADLGAWLRGRMRFESLTGAEVRLDRSPIREKRWRIPRIPGLGYYPAVDAISVGHLVIGRTVLGHVVAAAVNGRIECPDAEGKERIVLSGRRSDGIAGSFELSYAQGREAPTFRAHLDDSEVLPSRLGLGSPLVLDLAGSGPRKDWQGTLKATASAVDILQGKVQFSGEFPTFISGSLDANVAPLRRLQALERFLGPDAHVSFEALLAKAGRLDILELAAASPSGMIQGAGTALLMEKEFSLSLQANHADLSLLTCREEGTGLYLPAEISVSVAGDASKIKVDVVASSGSAPLVYAETTMVTGTAVQLDGLANIFTAPLAGTDAARKMLGERNAIAWSARFEAPGHLFLNSLALDDQVVGVNASGSVEFPSASANIGYAGVLHTEFLHGLAENLGSEKEVSFSGKISDSLTAPAVSIAASHIDVAAGGISMKEGTLSVGFHLKPSGMKRAIRNGMARVEFPLCSYKDGPGLAVSCTTSLESDDLDDIHFQGIEVLAPALGGKLTADLDYGRTTGKAGFHGRIRLDDVAATSVLYPHPFGGALSGSFHGEKSKGPEPLKMNAECDWDHPSGLPEAAARLAGSKLRAAVHLESGENRIRVDDARLELEAGTIRANGWQNKGDRRFKFLLDTESVNLAKATAESSGKIGGLLDMSTHVEGLPDDFSVSGDTNIKGFVWDRLSVRNTKLKFKAEHLPVRPMGTVTIAMSNGKQGPSLDGSLAYRYQERLLHVEKAKFTSSKNHMGGSLDYHSDSGEFSANADFALPALKDLSVLFGVDLSGTAEGKVAASRKGEELDISLLGKAEKLGTPWGSIGLLDANGAATDLLRKPQGNAKIIASDVGGKGFQLAKADVTLSGDGSSLSAKAAMSGRYQKTETSAPLPFQMKTSARASFQSQDLILSEATGQVADVDFSLAGPAHIHRSGAGYSLDNTAYHLGGGGGEVSIDTSGNSIHAASSWKDIPLSAARLAGLGSVYGTSSGTLAVEGPLQAPTCRLEMLLAKAGKADYGQPPGVDVSVKAVHDGHWMSAEISASLSDAAKAGVSARIPLNLSLTPANIAVREQDVLQADAEVSADLAALAVLMNRMNDLPKGTLTGKFGLAGTMAAPKVSGELNLKNGGYENLVYGALIKNLQARLIADGSTVRIAEFSGTDGGNGKLSATGQMEVSFAQKHPFHVDVTLDRMRSLRSEYGTAMLSGTLQLAGNLAEAGVKGGITVEEGDFKLPERMSPSKTGKVEFTDKNAPERPAPIVAVGTPNLPAIALDVSVAVPGRMSVRAPVLETEWNGDMHVRGTLKEPRVRGDLRVRRGYLDLIGQRFDLADSTVGFANGDLRTPYLNMTGVCTATDITARIQVSGPPSDAQLTLSSEPSLPQDEILSKLLFRKGVSQASPMQAIQIARAASMFSDRLSVAQFLTGSVKLPGVDLFDIRSGEKVDKTVVGVGKYINDKIYVEAEQGPAADSGRVSAQVEVAPRVSVKADVGARNRGGVGIMWKKDY